MEREMVYAFVVVAGLWAISDAVSIRTKSYVSVILSGCTLFLIGFWFKIIPTDIIDTSVIGKVSGLCNILLVAHMGSLIDVEELKREWKTVVVALASLASLAAVMLTVGRWALGNQMAVAATSPIAGGLVATLIIAEQATKLGLPDIAVFATLILAFQNFVGIPITSLCLNREIDHLLIDPNFISSQNVHKKDEENKNEPLHERKTLFHTPERFQTPYILLFKIAIIAFISYWLGKYTEAIYIHPKILCLIIGAIAHQVGFLEDNILVKANSSGFINLAIATTLPYLLSQSTPEQVFKLLMPLIISLAIGAVGLVIGAIIAGKFVGYSPRMSSSIGLSAMYGFPTSYIVSTEVSKSRGRTPEEQEALIAYIMPKVVVAGFVTVTSRICHYGRNHGQYAVMEESN